MKLTFSLKKWLFPSAFFLLLLIIWEIASFAFSELFFILPAPSSIIAGIIENFELFQVHATITLKEILIGLLTAFLLALPAAWLMSEFKTAKWTIQPLFVISQSIPMFALAPIMVIWFGWSFTAIVIPTALMVFFPLALTLYQGLAATPVEWIEFFKLQKASKWHVFTKLSIPYALPHLFSGLKISAAIAAIGAVSAEWAGAQLGLGVLIQESRRSTDLKTAFGAIFCVILLSLSLYFLTTLMEKIVCNRKYRCLFKKSLAHTSSLLIALTLFGCSQTNDTPNKISPHQTHEEIKLLLDWFPNPNHVPLYAGIQKGFFEAEGIFLHLQKIFDPGDTIPYLTSKQTDLAIYYMPQTLQAAAQGAQCKVIGKLIPTPLNCLLFLKSSHIETLSDLNDKVLGCSMGTLNSVYMEKLCKFQNIKLKNKIRLSSDLASALSTKHVDIVQGACWNIESEQLKALNLDTSYIPLTQFGIPSYEELIVLANDTILKKDNFVERFQRALANSIAYSQQYPEDAFALYLHANPSKMHYTKTWEKRAWQKTHPLFAQDQLFDTKTWQDFANWMYENKLITQPYNVLSLCPSS